MTNKNETNQNKYMQIRCDEEFKAKVNALKAKEHLISSSDYVRRLVLQEYDKQFNT